MIRISKQTLVQNTNLQILRQQCECAVIIFNMYNNVKLLTFFRQRRFLMVSCTSNSQSTTVPLSPLSICICLYLFFTSDQHLELHLVFTLYLHVAHTLLMWYSHTTHTLCTFLAAYFHVPHMLPIPYSCHSLYSHVVHITYTLLTHCSQFSLNWLKCKFSFSSQKSLRPEINL